METFATRYVRMISNPVLRMFSPLKNWFARKSPNHLRQIWISFDGKTITANGPLARKVSVKITDIHEIGIKTTDTGPFIEDVFWLINRETHALHVPSESPVFNILMDRFGSFDDFDWKPFADAMCCTDCQYFLCWKRSQESARTVITENVNK